MHPTNPKWRVIVGFALCFVISMLWSVALAGLVSRTTRKNPLLIAGEILLLLAQITTVGLMWRRWKQAAMGVLLYAGCEVVWVLAAWLVFPRA